MMSKNSLRSSNFAEEIHFKSAFDDDVRVPDGKLASVREEDNDELSNLLSYAMNLFYHHDYLTLKEVADKILVFDYRNIRGCLYKSFIDFFEQFDQYERETSALWNKTEQTKEESGVQAKPKEIFWEQSNFDFINDTNRYLEYLESLENLSKQLHEISEITELIREEEIVQELIIERLVFLDQKISISVNEIVETDQIPTIAITFNYLKRLYSDKYDEIMGRKDQIMMLSEKEYCGGK